MPRYRSPGLKGPLPPGAERPALGGLLPVYRLGPALRAPTARFPPGPPASTSKGEKADGRALNGMRLPTSRERMSTSCPRVSALTTVSAPCTALTPALQDRRHQGSSRPQRRRCRPGACHRPSSSRRRLQDAQSRRIRRDPGSRRLRLARLALPSLFGVSSAIRLASLDTLPAPMKRLINGITDTPETSRERQSR
jgi:hypothetical protein